MLSAVIAVAGTVTYVRYTNVANDELYYYVYSVTGDGQNPPGEIWTYIASQVMEDIQSPYTNWYHAGTVSHPNLIAPGSYRVKVYRDTPNTAFDEYLGWAPVTAY